MDGVVLYDKPAGITSHDVVAGMRRQVGRGVKVGHAGTLDPFATGLLLVLVGRATRVQRFLMALEKTYVVLARFGAVSTTGDPDGTILATGALPAGEIPLPTGLIRQRPPAYSAVKVAGRRAYALARAGVEVELPERMVHVRRFEELERSGPGEEPVRRRYLIQCSSGTYVRSLIADLGDAYCEELRRVAIGRFSVEEADPERVISLERALDFMPAVVLSGEAARRAAHGAAVAADPRVGPKEGRRTDPREGPGTDPGEGPGTDPRVGPGTDPGEPAPAIVRLVDQAGLIALAEPRDGLLKPIVGLRPAG